MSKRFKGKTCAYCAVPEASTTGDHVLAREFVAVEHRNQIPKVPACDGCNNRKSALETLFTAVLPFGGRHADASANLTVNVPKRLARHPKLHQSLAAGQSQVWSREPSGLLVRSLALPLDGERLEELVDLIVRGLMFHHWGVALGADMHVGVFTLTRYGEALFASYLNSNAKQRVSNNIGAGAFVYEAVQGVDNDTVSMWRLSIYGGMTMDSGDGKHAMSSFGVMTGPQRIIDRAEQRVASGHYIIRV